MGTEEEYDRLIVIAERLAFKRNRTPEECTLYKLLVMLIEAYEVQNYLIDQAAPHEILQHILESSGTCQADLVGVIGSSDVISEIVNGDRLISKVQAKILGDYFKVSPTLFT